MKDEILPIGSIVTVKGQDVMICAYFKKGAKINNDYYDYACCLYPSGVAKDSILLKKKDIERVKFVGYQDERFAEFKKYLENLK